MSVQLRDCKVKQVPYRMYVGGGDAVQSHMPAEAAVELLERNVAAKVDHEFGISITVDGYEMRFRTEDFDGVEFPEPPKPKKRGKAK